MRKPALEVCCSCLLAMSMLVLCNLALSAQDNSSPAPIVRSAVSFGVSAPLRELAKLPAPSQYGLPANHLLRPMRRGSAGHVVDTVEQSTAASGSNSSIKVNVGGIGVGFSGFISGFSYPNANIAVGDIQVVEVVNNSGAVYNKSTGVWTSASYLNPNYIWTTGPCSQYSPEAYPIVQWDVAAHRWLLAENVVAGPPYAGYACIAVSTGIDATGSYYLYEFPLGNGWPEVL